jgi:hypothetical protein
LHLNLLFMRLSSCGLISVFACRVVGRHFEVIILLSFIRSLVQ